jgi:3-hydroxy acid dehydrogenase/malonic semialdehyde reductase
VAISATILQPCYLPCFTLTRDSIMIVFITGASAGFGAAMARTFVKNGHQVVLAARRKERLDALAAELGESALPIAMDVTDKASIEEALSMLPQSWRQIDVLINNAGLALNTKPAHEVPLEDWHTMIDTNVKGLVTMTHALLPAMVERGSGLIINLGSVAGHYPYPGGNGSRSTCVPTWWAPACAPPTWPPACVAAPNSRTCA